MAVHKRESNQDNRSLESGRGCADRISLLSSVHSTGTVSQRVSPRSQVCGHLIGESSFVVWDIGRFGYGSDHKDGDFGKVKVNIWKPVTVRSSRVVLTCRAEYSPVLHLCTSEYLGKLKGKQPMTLFNFSKIGEN